MNYKGNNYKGNNYLITKLINLKVYLNLFKHYVEIITIFYKVLY